MCVFMFVHLCVSARQEMTRLHKVGLDAAIV